jgi:sugar phosphate isomerase/epimerase
MAAAVTVAASRAQTPRLKLGLDSYTLRGFKWNAFQLLDYAGRMKLDTIQLDLSTYESLETAYVRRVREHAGNLGIVVDGSMGCICPSSSSWKPASGDPVEYLRTGLRVAHEVGATCTRVFVGGFAERVGSVPLEAHVENTRKVLRAVRSQAIDLGVKIAIENHGDFQAWELRELIEAAGSDFVGACLDSGNAITVMEDPLTTVEVLGSYTITTHIRDSVVFEHPRGAVTQWVALGDGIVDFRAFFDTFRRVCGTSGVQLEILTGGPPRVVPFLERDYWKAFPKARALDFARFLKLARNGRPFMGSMVMVRSGEGPQAYEAALREQQRVDLERSFAYARKELGMGIRS